MQDEKSESLKKEIDNTISGLSETAGWMKLVKESLTQFETETAAGSTQRYRWALLPLIVCEAISQQYERALPAAAALQLLRSAADIFDDIEDSDSQVSICAKYGNAISINLATGLVILAEKTLTGLTRKGVESNLAVNVIETVNDYYSRACAGQHLDLFLSPAEFSSEDVYLKVAYLKSASSIECACRTGTLLATSNPELVDKFTAFGQNLGMAAQIANDIQGTLIKNDIHKHKITLPVVFALDHSSEETHQILDTYFVKQREISQTVEQIRELITSSGAINYATFKMELYRQMAIEVLQGIEKTGIRTEELKVFLGRYS
jgi:geranylgeranyl pyrophosphate synthase